MTERKRCTYDELNEIMGDDERFAALDQSLDQKGYEMNGAYVSCDDDGAFLIASLGRYGGCATARWEDKKLGPVYTLVRPA